MYILMYFTILVIISLITKIKYKSFLKANIIFTFIWCFSGSIASIGLFDLYKPYINVHFFSLAFIVFFNLFFFIFNKNYIFKEYIGDYITGKLRFKIIYIFNFASWLYMLRFLVKSINIIKSGGFSSLRVYAYNSSLGLWSTSELIIAQNIVQPIFMATILVTCFCYIVNKKNKALLIISLIDIGIYLLSFGGRAILIDSIIFYLIMYFVVRTNRKENKKKWKINKSFIIIGVLVFSIITRSRSWIKTNLIKEIFYYFIGSFSFLGIILEEQVGMSSNLLYGKATFGFIYNLIFKVLTFLFKVPYNGSDFQITNITAQVRLISPTRGFNALTTAIYPLLRDFGFFGIIFGAAFLAWAISFLEKHFKKTNNIYYLCLYTVLLNILFNSTLNYYLYSSAYGMVMIILLIFINTKANVIKVETS